MDTGRPWAYANVMEIKDVSDTATWVAHYRALENERTDALFRDPYAKALVGDRGAAIANVMKRTAPFTQWTVVIRTATIDRMIQSVIATDHIDMVVNLGAGLDTRPYRLAIPASVKWIEVDYPHIIEHKAKTLANEKPLVQLERVALDLADREKRQALFARLNDLSQNILVITEGVILYLDEKSVGELADDLHATPSFRFWIAEYLAAHTYAVISTANRKTELKNSPFKFMPKDWFGFFSNHGWKKRDVHFLPDEAKRFNRPPPIPLLGRLFLQYLAPRFIAEKFMKMSAYVVFDKNP